MNLSAKEINLAVHLLKMASDSYSNHGCNDLDQETIDAAGFTEAEASQFVAEYREWNGDPEWPTIFENMMDYAIMSFIAEKLRRTTK
jgi:hypothetical protein